MTIKELILKYEAIRDILLREVINYNSPINKLKLQIYEDILNDLFIVDLKTIYSVTYFIDGFEYQQEYFSKEAAIRYAKDLKNAEDILVRKITTNYVDYEEIEIINF